MRHTTHPLEFFPYLCTVIKRNTICKDLPKDISSNTLATFGNGWPTIKVKRSEFHLAEEDKYDCLEDKWAAILINGGTLVVYDDYEVEELEEGEKPTKYTLTLKDVRKGLRLMKKNYPNHYNDLMEECEDAITGDVWLQLAVFGELIYG